MIKRMYSLKYKARKYTHTHNRDNAKAKVLPNIRQEQEQDRVLRRVYCSLVVLRVEDFFFFFFFFLVAQVFSHNGQNCS